MNNSIQPNRLWNYPPVTQEEDTGYRKNNLKIMPIEVEEVSYTCHDKVSAGVEVLAKCSSNYSIVGSYHLHCKTERYYKYSRYCRTCNEGKI